MRVFRVWPKRIKRANGQILTPEMVVVVTTQYYAPTPFTNGGQELKRLYMSIYGCDIQKLGCCPGDFNYKALG